MQSPGARNLDVFQAAFDDLNLHYPIYQGLRRQDRPGGDVAVVQIQLGHRRAGLENLGEGDGTIGKGLGYRCQGLRGKHRTAHHLKALDDEGGSIARGGNFRARGLGLRARLQ
ncbi:hypothetical protein XM38_050300 [Halomicronema hongdechloris C2206]|uniref:Uncharacterized protein n=1 Tax=Halomicronema hongdechloris C2206 TaxID=1641165 RepID=A0A1Z3HUU7_9CYAN|nr:hypothetical protein XM38_050300 [Halomicronema hongdechloris C2206]